MSHLKAKFTKYFKQFPKLMGKLKILRKNLNTQAKKLKVSENPHGLLAKQQSKKACHSNLYFAYADIMPTLMSGFRNCPVSTGFIRVSRLLFWFWMRKGAVSSSLLLALLAL